MAMLRKVFAPQQETMGRPTFGGFSPDGMNQRPQIGGQTQGGMNPWANIRPNMGGQMNALQGGQAFQGGDLLQMLQRMYQQRPRRNFGNDLTSAGNALSKLWMGRNE